MADPQPSALLWGQDYLLLYNEAYIVFLGMSAPQADPSTNNPYQGKSKHPDVLGKSVDEAWPGIADDLISLYEEVSSARQGMTIANAAFDMDRNGFLEEVFVTYSMIPIIGDDGAIAMYATLRRHFAVLD